MEVLFLHNYQLGGGPEEGERHVEWGVMSFGQKPNYSFFAFKPPLTLVKQDPPFSKVVISNINNVIKYSVSLPWAPL